MKSLFIILILFALAGCSPRPHSLLSETFVIRAPEAVDEGSMHGTSFVLTTDREATVSLDADGKHMNVLVSAAGKPPHEARVVLAAGTAASNLAHGDSAQILLRVESGGSDVGAPTIYSIPAGAKLNEFFISSVAPGMFPLGTPLTLGTLNSKPILLTVTSPPK
ncbi:MAG: hypothetical protein QOD99_34 [Chthoniobacter sp.]|jgi:hypothetical protein|nr:hypothetical protein [Chthoniobacter sp.]